MFLLGVRVDHALSAAFLVIMEKLIKNVRHHYTVKEARRVPAAACRDEITTFYNDRAYTIRKRIYSQDRRPKKDVSARPTIVMAVGQDDVPLVQALRLTDVLVEAVILFNDSEEALSSLIPARAGIGKNHPASEQMMHETLSQVMEQQRLLPPAEAISRGNQLLVELDHMLETRRREAPDQPPCTPMEPLLIAAAAPIWFRENVRYTSAYRASSTSVRCFK